jgi:hypothetical protein
MNTVEDFLTTIVDGFGDITRPDDWKYRGVDDFVLRHGREMKPSSVYAGFASGQMKACYENASKLAMSNDVFTYVEGYAHSVIPVAHAWCIDDKGRVIDPTWPDAMECEYFGVAFTDIYLRRRMLESEVWGIFWAATVNLELMRGDFVPMDVLQ